jgi:hypothetical protein
MNYMFVWALKFNQDLSEWNVEKVSEHHNFLSYATSWTLPKPNFN